jgi:hypothetical protein
VAVESPEHTVLQARVRYSLAASSRIPYKCRSMKQYTVALLVAICACGSPSDDTTPGDDAIKGDDQPGDDQPGDDEPSGPAVFETEHPRIYLPRNRDRLIAALGTPAGQRFRAMVDGHLDGANYYNYRAWFSALVGALTDDPAYCASAVEEIDTFVADEEALVGAGSRADIAYDSYLEVGPKIMNVALTYDWCFDSTSASQRDRWNAYTQQAVWNVWHHEDAEWGGVSYPWTGWSTDNPSDNYYYSFITATMLFGLAAHDEHPDAAGWLAYFRDEKIGGELVPTFAADLEGGGSREGTGYGVAMMNLWNVYELWKGSTGENLARLTGHARASMLQMMHAIVPTLDRVAPIGDHARDSSASLFDYHRNYLQELAAIFPNDELTPRVRGLLTASSVPEMDQYFMTVYDFIYGAAQATEQPMDGMGTVFHAPGNGVLYARSGWDTDATWLSLVAGPYTESHAHRDQGSFMIYKGEWLAEDANLHSHSGLHQEEDVHNLVRITSGGQTIRQRAHTVSELVALATGTGWLHAAADLTPAYDGQAGVTRVERELVYLEPNAVVVFDRVTTAPGTQQIWQLNAPVSPSVSGTRTTITGAYHTLRAERVVPASASTSVHAWPSQDSDLDGGYRVDTTVAGGENTFLHVLWLDGAVGTVARSDANGRIGVSVTAGGTTATVRFSPSGVDGTLDIGGDAFALQAGVEAMPE